MSRVAYVNGQYQPHGQATVHVEDRGFQFADGVYEVWAVFDGRLADYEGHMTRLGRSLSELRIPPPMTKEALTRVLRETIRRRDHVFPAEGTPPSVIVTAKNLNYPRSEAQAAKGVAVITQPDIRWGRCDIKTVGLLPNALAKQAAKEHGAAEAWFVDDMGLVTEGSSTNAWIVDQDGKLRTRDTQANILRGITRAAVLDILALEGFELDERPFSVDEAKAAKEAFYTSASGFVTPAISIDGAKIGDGKPGPVATKLRARYIEAARRDAI
jgi:D-alanine transaminase